MHIGKKHFTGLILVVYLLSRLLQSVFFVNITKTFAEDPIEETKLVAIFVDDSIYDDIKTDVERYATKYIQGESAGTRYAALPNSKALVFPINTETFQAKDITKILENLYFEGIKEEPSKLVGTVLIGNIPLPVINDDGTIYPSVFPYVDFEEQKFVRNAEQNYFVPNGNPNGQAELRHGWINYQDEDEYHNYFSKLQAYVLNPADFIGKDIWYDDFIDTKNNFFIEGVPSYVNNFLFAEDLVYHRYSNLMYNILQSENNEEVSDILAGFDGMDQVLAAQEQTSVPTMTLQKTIQEGFLKSYSELIGKKQLVRIRDNVKTAGRWIEDSVAAGVTNERLAIDSHYYKVEQKDDVLFRSSSSLQPALVAANEALESLVNEKIETEKYYMTIPILTSYRDRSAGDDADAKKKWAFYKNFYFGTKAESITNAQQLSIYRGTYLNYTGIDGLGINNDLKSIGGSYNIFSQQIQANRGFNVLNSQADSELFNPEFEGGKIFDSSYYGGGKLVNAWKLKKGKWKEKNNKKWTNIVSEANGCSDSDSDESNNCTEKGTEEGGQDIINKNRGGATPLNLDAEKISQGIYTFKTYFYQDARNPLYDIAGSAAISTPEPKANSYSGYTTYASVIKTHVADGSLAYIYPRALTEDGDTIDQATLYNVNGEWVGFVHKQKVGYSSVDFFNQYGAADDTASYPSSKSFTLMKDETADEYDKYIYNYKLLDSRVYNISPTPEQIYGYVEYYFNGPSSTVKPFYEDMKEYLMNLGNDITENIVIPDTLIMTEFQKLQTTVNNYSASITGYIKTINTTSGTLASSLSYLNALANSGTLLITGGTYDTITTLKSSIRSGQKIVYEYLIDSRLEQERFGVVINKTEYSSLSFNPLQSIISTFQRVGNTVKKGVFSISPNDNITLLQNRVDDIKGQMQTMKQQVDVFKSHHEYFKQEIAVLTGKNTQLISQLTTQKNYLQTWKTCSGTYLTGTPATIHTGLHACGCFSGTYFSNDGYYKPICDSIQELTGELTYLNSLITSIITSTVQRTGETQEINVFGIETDYNEFLYTTTPVAEIDSGLAYHYSYTAPTTFLNFSRQRIPLGFLNSYVTTLDSINRFQTVAEDYEIKKGGMTEITQDRPIDNIRNVTFKGIGNSVVELQYPNLYKVPVYKHVGDTLVLKTPDQIALAIKEYLRALENEYNAKLTGQLANKMTYYYQSPSAFNFLAGVDPLATPNRSYNKFSPGELENNLRTKIESSSFFQDNMGGMDPIDFIAQILYYQNISWKERPLSDVITDDITQIQNTVDINEKISNVLTTYLVKNQDKGSFITPEYRPEGYEVAFLNSNGEDYITIKESSPFVQQLQSATAVPKNTQAPSTDGDIAAEIDQKCGVDTDGSVDLIDFSDMSSPWLKAFFCWLEEVKTKPLEFSFDRSSVQGPAINLEDDAWTQTFGEQEENISEHYQNYGFGNTDEGNQNTLGSLPQNVDGSKLNEIGSYTQFNKGETTRNVIDRTGTLIISSTKSFGNVDMYISSTGHSCINVYEGSSPITANACTTKGKITVDPINTTTLGINLLDNNAGITIVKLDMCLPNTQYCLSKTMKVDILPGPIQQTIITPFASRVLAGVPFSLDVQGTDIYGNNVGQLVQESFVISANTGTLTNGSAAKESVRFNNFNNSTFTYITDPATPHNTPAVFTITGSLENSLTLTIIQSKLIVESSLSGWNQTQQTGHFSFALPNTESVYKKKDEYNIVQTQKNNLPRLRVLLQDLDGNAIAIKTPIAVSSKHNLVKLGTIGEEFKTIQTGGWTFQIPQQKFIENSLITIQSGWLDIYMYPNFQIGEDTIILQLPGREKIEIPLFVYPGDAQRILINTDKDVLHTNSSCSGTLTITDARNNVVSKRTEVKLGAIGTLIIPGLTGNSRTIPVYSGEHSFSINGSYKGGEGHIFAMISGLQMEEQTPGYKKIMVQNTLIPDTGLNIMYLNIFGNDWGNQWGYFSDNKQYVEGLMKKSDKILATTTQLISPTKLKRISLLVDNKGTITDFDSNDIFLQVTPTALSYTIYNVGTISFANNFSLQEVVGEEEDLATIINDFETTTYTDQNVLYYIPEGIDSIIASNTVQDTRILINNEVAFDLANGISSGYNVQLQDSPLENYQTWIISNSEGTSIGRFILRANAETSFIQGTDIVATIDTPAPQYKTTLTWSAGSTNADQAIGLYDIESSFDPSTKGYDSIEDSTNPELNIGFRSDFKNITLFGGGKSVGESTIPFGSEFLINLGDPLLKRIDQNRTVTVKSRTGEVLLDTHLDGGVDQSIYTEPGKTIFKVLSIDFNNDNLQDILIAFTDGTVKLLKNYGGKEPFTQMGNLMVFADGIKEIFIGDTDGNDYEDIILRTKGDQLRVYKNEFGIFDVDGYPVCLNTNVKDGEINSRPSDLGTVEQVFIKDMNNDDVLDIVTNDVYGYVKIFYGGSDNTQDEANYISTIKYACDDDWSTRQIFSNGGKNIKVVTRFGIKINETTSVVDSSLVRWKGLEEPTIDGSDPTDLGITPDADTSAIDNYVNTTDEVDQDVLAGMINDLTSSIGPANFDLSQMMNAGEDIYAKYKADPFGIRPVYEGTGSTGEIIYALISYLTGSDPVEIHKTYMDLNGDILEPGDKVMITVNLKATQNFTGTFADKISGPWVIDTFPDNSMKYFWFSTGGAQTINMFGTTFNLPGFSGSYMNQGNIDDLDFRRILDNGYYMLDNITLPKNKILERHYVVSYQGDDTVTRIDIEDLTGSLFNDLSGNPLPYVQDNLPDIKVYPTDDCSKALFTFFNNHTASNKGYQQEYIDLMKAIVEYNQNAQNTYTAAMGDIQNTIADFSSNAETSNVPGMSSTFESRNPVDLLGDVSSIDFGQLFTTSSEGLDFSNLVNAPMQILDSVLGGVTEKIDGLMGGLCNGYKIGGDSCAVLPVPFNQAFLAPGKYHLFGCQTIPLDPLENGVPILEFPGNWVIPPVSTYVPAPNIFGFPFRGPTDGHLGGPKTGPLGPTISSSQVRIYVAPTLTLQLGVAMCFGPYTVGNNIPKPVNAVGGNCVVFSIPIGLPCNEEDDPSDGNDIPYPLAETEGGGTCSHSDGPTAGNNGFSGSPFQMVNTAGNANTPTPSIPDGSYVGGFFNFDKEPIFNSSAGGGISFDDIKLEGGLKGVQNKIQGGKIKGIAKILVQKWLDKQVKFVLNNLTKMRIDIYFPDFGDLFQGFDKLGEASDEYEKNKCLEKGGTWQENPSYCQENEKEACKLKGKERDEENGGCVTPKKNTQNTKGLEKINNIASNSLLERGQFQEFSESFGNPFEKLEAMFAEVPLINLRTENITIKVPMITSEDVIAYTSMLQNWLKVNESILEQWKKFFKHIFALCNNKNIDDIKDLKKEYEEIMENLKAQMKDLSSFISIDEAETANKDIAGLQTKINNLKSFTKDYDLSDLGLYDFYEGCGGEYYIKLLRNEPSEVLPREVFIEIKGSTPRMYTKGYELVEKNKSLSTKISLSIQQKVGEQYIASAPCLAKKYSSNKNACMELFFNPKFKVALSAYVNFQSNADLLIASVKQNIKTLEKYKRFPFQLYERIHVTDRYMSELSSLIKNFLGTLGTWMKTNATRYSQYVNAFITMITVIQTFQIIPDFAANWSKRCGSCTVDNYDLYNCIISLLCSDAVLPVLPIPPLKIPNIYIDLSHVALGLDIKIPKFTFIPTKISVPKLPNLPEPPKVDFALTLEELAGLGIDAIANLIGGLSFLQEIQIPAIPLLPEPPELQPLPSFLPTVKLELPTLPPAPKIPEIPNELSATMDLAKTVGTVLCIVKGNVGLVGEEGVKAKIEQLTQRDWELPFWDTFDQTPSWMSNTANFLESSQNMLNSDQPLMGFDYEISSYVNLQYSFEGVYNVINDLTQYVNRFINIVDLEQTSENLVQTVDTYSNELSKAAQDLVNSGASLANYVVDEAEKVKEIGTIIEKCLTDPTNTGPIIIRGITYKGCENLEGLEAIYTETKAQFDAAMAIYNEAKQKTEDALKEAEAWAEENVKELFDDIEARNTKIKEQLENAKTKQEKDRKIRERKLQDLYVKPLSYNISDISQGYTISDEDNQATYEKNKENMMKGLSFVKQNTTDEAFTNRVDSVLSLLDSDLEIKAETDAINQAQYEAESILQDYRAQTETLATLIEKDYPKFLASIENNTVAMVDDKSEETTITTSLFSMDEEAKQLLLAHKETPIELYLEAQKTRAEGFSNALGSTDAATLGISEAAYSDQKTYFTKVEQTISDTLSFAENPITTENPIIAMNTVSSETPTKASADKISEQPLIAQSCPTCGSSSASSDASSLLGTDVSSYIKGVFVDGYITNASGTQKKKINVVSEDSMIQNIGKNYYSHDLNKDGKDDLIMRDDNTVYVKYYDQNTTFASGGPTHWYDNYYIYELTSPEDLWDNSDEGYVEISDIQVKLIDRSREVKNFKMAGQTFETIKYSFSNSLSLGDTPDAYVIKMNHRSDTFHDKELLLDSSSEELLNKKYILVVPEGFAYTGIEITLDEGTDDIEDLLTGTIIAIKEYTANEDTIQVVLQNIPRNRQYAQISSYLLENTTLKKSGPWSNQTVAGTQIIGDELPPEPTITLYRPAIDEVIGTGENLKGFIGTNYILNINWRDNAFMSGASLFDADGNTLLQKRIWNITGDMALSGLFFTGDTSMKLNLVGDDVNGNISSTEVVLDISTPEITITDITKYTQGAENIAIPGTIIAELSNDIDEGYVQFLRQRNTIRKTLTGTLDGIALDSYPVSPKQVIITGGYYDMGSMIGLYISNGTLIGEINPNNGELSILPAYQSRMVPYVDLSSHIPIIKINDTLENKIIFWIALPVQELVTINPGSLTQAELTRPEFGSFAGGWALSKEGVALLYISPTGNIYTDQPLFATYQFNDQEETLTYYFQEQEGGSSVASVTVKITPF